MVFGLGPGKMSSPSPTLGRRCHWGLAELWAGLDEEQLGRCAPGAALHPGLPGPKSTSWVSVGPLRLLLGPVVMVAACCPASSTKGSFAFSTPCSPARSPPFLIIFINVQRSCYTLYKYLHPQAGRNLSLATSTVSGRACSLPEQLQQIWLPLVRRGQALVWGAHGPRRVEGAVGGRNSARKKSQGCGRNPSSLWLPM